MYNTILPHFYLYYSNEYVGAGFNENKKIGPSPILTVEFKKGTISKTTLALRRPKAGVRPGRWSFSEWCLSSTAIKIIAQSFYVLF